MYWLGLDDLIVGAYKADSTAGKSYVIFGKKDSITIDLSAIASGTGGFVINGESEVNWSGLTSPAVETDWPFQSFLISPLMTKPPVPLAMADMSIAVLSILPKMT
jgi:hypothetical protein